MDRRTKRLRREEIGKGEGNWWFKKKELKRGKEGKKSWNYSEEKEQERETDVTRPSDRIPYATAFLICKSWYIKRHWVAGPYIKRHRVAGPYIKRHWVAGPYKRHWVAGPYIRHHWVAGLYIKRHWSGGTVHQAPLSGGTVHQAPPSGGTVHQAPLSGRTVQAPLGGRTVHQAPLSGGTVHQAPLKWRDRTSSATKWRTLASLIYFTKKGKKRYSVNRVD